MSSEVEELVTHFVVMCNYKPSITASKSVTYVEGLRSAVLFILKVRGVTSKLAHKNHRIL